MANLRVTIPIGSIRKLKRYECAMARMKPLRTLSKHLFCKRRSDKGRQKFMKNDPLIVPTQQPGCFLEHAIVYHSGESRFIHERVVGFEHGEMQLRHQHVRIVARITYDRGTLPVSLQICSIQAKQKLRRVVTLEEERVAGRPVAVQCFQVELRAAGVVAFRRVGMGSQSGSVRRYIVSYKLAEDRPASRGVSQGFGGILDVSAI